MARYEYQGDEELETSTNKWMLVGGVLMLCMAAVFPLYRWFEPTNREAAREQNLESLAEQGEEMWAISCASCHGLNGEGLIGPALNSQQFMQSASDDQIQLLIAVGVPGSQMSAYSQDHGGPLTSEQIRALQIFIRTWEPTAPDLPGWRDMVGN
ncbi:MAG: cytochrome c [Acidimicrobiales bacterium]|nr:cytochrome c [Acidimicrobiales bacterium]